MANYIQNDSQSRSDKISKLIGNYLLKRYTMLATTCPTCDTILLRKPDGKDYCVTCSEIDNYIPDLITEKDFIKRSPQNISTLHYKEPNFYHNKSNSCDTNDLIKNIIEKGIRSRLEKSLKSLIDEECPDKQIKILQVINMSLDIEERLTK